MKTKYFKIVAGIAAVLFAIGGSFMSHASERTNPNQIIPGYATTNAANPCEIPVACSTTPSAYCTISLGVFTYYAFGKLGPAYCPVTLYRYN